MAIANTNHPALIERLKIESPRAGLYHATIIPKENVTVEALAQLREQLGHASYSTLMDTKEGRAVIEVRGFKNEEKLLACLAKCGLQPGQVERDKAVDEKNHSFREKVRGKSLFLSAVFYDIGNAAFFASGIQRGRHNLGGKFTTNDISELLIGATFSIGDVLMTFYGHERGDEELDAAATSIKKHLHQKGIDLPDIATLNPDVIHQTGIAKAADRWLRKNIINVKCMSEMAGGLFTTHAGFKPGNRNNGKVAAGMLLSSGWLGTLFLDKSNAERIVDGTSPPPANLIDEAKDNPRGMIARPLSMANNLANLWGSLNPKTGERARFQQQVVDAQRQFDLNPSTENRAHLKYTQVKQHDYVWNVVSACSFLIAHTLFGLSGEKRPPETEDDKTLMNDMVLLSANMLAGQSKAVRAHAVRDIAEHVSSFAHINASVDEITQAINEKVDALAHSKWATRMQENKQQPGAAL